MEVRNRRRLIFLLKLAFSAGVMLLIFRKVFEHQNAQELTEQLGRLTWPWLGVAALMQLGAILCSVLRWDRLLVGQGIHAPFRHLFGSFMIGRFFGAFTPGGWTGLNGYRLYDIARYTGKTARSTATIGIEMVLGQLAFGAVVIAGSVFGLRYIGVEGVLLVDGFFVVLIATAVLLLSRPVLFRRMADLLPMALRARVRSLVDAVCAYQGKTRLVIQAALLGMGTHAFNNLIYVSTARALGLELGIGEIFFASALQIFATLLPASVNGIGLREAAAVELYTKVGIPMGLAVLVPMVGFSVEMAVSAIGGIVLLTRRQSYRPDIKVDDPDRERISHDAIPIANEEKRPRIRRGLAIGFSAGLLAGLLVGLGEATVILISSKTSPDLGVLAYGGIAYGLFFAAGGAVLGAALAWSGRIMKRQAFPQPVAYARTAAFMVATASFALGAFRVRRDLFHEELVWKSGVGLGVLLSCALAALVLYVALRRTLQALTERKVGLFLLKPWGTPLAAATVLGAIALMATLGQSDKAGAALEGASSTQPASAQSILFVVVDTLRADHLPSYGYKTGSTPNLDAFGRDAVRFHQAFANASWTRPSFASLLTGRFAASHNVMSKADSLADELVTLPEALAAAGYTTAGVVTNYNVAPFFNFHQGFDEYTYLEPDFVLGANDTAAKLLLVQFLRQRIERYKALRGVVEPGSAYQDAAVVNKQLFARLGKLKARKAPQKPFFLFAAYMDPHDPYFEHPYSGSGYSRAGHPHPKASEAKALRQLYDGEITYWDQEFGKLVHHLKEQGLYDDLTIVVTSDHGEEFMDHGGFWHGTTLYDEQLRVPLFVKLPGGDKGGTVVRHWVQSVDLMPTLLAQNGIAVPPGVQGGDAFVGSAEIYAEESHEGNVLQALRTRENTSELKLITANRGNPRGLAERELYRVDQDPSEATNLDDATAKTDQISQQLMLAEKRLAAHRTLAKDGRVARRAVDTRHDPSVAARLKALGYVGDE